MNDNSYGTQRQHHQQQQKQQPQAAYYPQATLIYPYQQPQPQVQYQPALTQEPEIHVGADPLQAADAGAYRRKSASADRDQLHWHQHPRNEAEVKELEKFQDDYSGREDTPLKEEDLEQALSEDVYSLLYTTNLCGPGFLYSLLILILQTALVWLLFFNLYDTGDNPNQTNGVENRMRIPAGVEYSVSTAQFLCLMLTVIIMVRHGDAMDGICQLAEGYEVDILKNSPNATFLRWIITALLKTSNGTMFLTLSFILTMQSEDVLDLFLNITGLHLLQEIDNLCFKFAAAGTVGQKIQYDCKHVSDMKQFVPRAMRMRIIWAKRLCSLTLTIGLLVPFAIYSSQQSNGKYLCSKAYVQFGDQIDPQFAYYSGIFERSLSGFLDGLVGSQSNRPVYVEATNTFQLAWCRSEQAWTVSRISDADSCKYIFKSASTVSFDVLDAAGQAWFYNNLGRGDIPVDWLKIACNDCATNPRLCHGDCIENTCQAKTENRLVYLNHTQSALPYSARLGMNFEFEFSNNCLYYSQEETTSSSLTGKEAGSSDDREAPIAFKPITTDSAGGALLYVTANSRLVYSDGDHIANEIAARILLFAGRRWIILEISKDISVSITAADRKNGLTYEEVGNNLAAFSAKPSPTTSILLLFSRKGYKPGYFSSGVNYGTMDDSVEPSHVTWFQASNDMYEPIFGVQPDESKPLDVKLQCSNCDRETPCKNGGVCRPDGTCQCSVFHSGRRCESSRKCTDGKSGGCINGGNCVQDSGTCICPEGYSGNLCQFGSNEISDYGVCDRIICDQEGNSNSDCSCGCFFSAFDPALCHFVLFYLSKDPQVYHAGYNEYLAFAANTTTFSTGGPPDPGGGGGEGRPGSNGEQAGGPGEGGGPPIENGGGPPNSEGGPPP